MKVNFIPDKVFLHLILHFMKTHMKGWNKFMHKQLYSTLYRETQYGKTPLQLALAMGKWDIANHSKTFKVQ